MIKRAIDEGSVSLHLLKNREQKPANRADAEPLKGTASFTIEASYKQIYDSCCMGAHIFITFSNIFITSLFIPISG